MPRERAAVIPIAGRFSTSPGEDAPYWQHLERVERWVRRLAGPTLEVEDLVQEVFLTACRKWSSFRHESELTTWLFGIARKVVSRALRKERLRRWWRRSDDDEVEAIAETGPGPADAYERKEAVASLYAALNRLPEAHRTAVILFELEALSTEELATLLGISPQNARVRLHRGRKQLLRELATNKGAKP